LIKAYDTRLLTTQEAIDASTRDQRSQHQIALLETRVESSLPLQRSPAHPPPAIDIGAEGFYTGRNIKKKGGDGAVLIPISRSQEPLLFSTHPFSEQEREDLVQRESEEAYWDAYRTDRQGGYNRNAIQNLRTSIPRKNRPAEPDAYCSEPVKPTYCAPRCYYQRTAGSSRHSDRPTRMWRRPGDGRLCIQNREPLDPCGNTQTPKLSHLREKDLTGDPNAQLQPRRTRTPSLYVPLAQPPRNVQPRQICDRTSCAALTDSGVAIGRHDDDGRC